MKDQKISNSQRMHVENQKLNGLFWKINKKNFLKHILFKKTLDDDGNIGCNERQNAK